MSTACRGKKSIFFFQWNFTEHTNLTYACNGQNNVNSVVFLETFFFFFVWVFYFFLPLLLFLHMCYGFWFCVFISLCVCICICLYMFPRFYFFSIFFFFSKEWEKEDMGLNGWGGSEDMGKEEGEAALIRMYYMVEVFFSVNGKRVSCMLGKHSTNWAKTLASSALLLPLFPPKWRNPRIHGETLILTDCRHFYPNCHCTGVKNTMFIKIRH